MKVFVKNSKVLTTGGKPIKVPEWGPGAKSAGATALRQVSGGPASLNCNDFAVNSRSWGFSAVTKPSKILTNTATNYSFGFINSAAPTSVTVAFLNGKSSIASMSNLVIGSAAFSFDITCTVEDTVSFTVTAVFGTGLSQMETYSFRAYNVMPVPTYTVSAVEGATYGFALNSDDYYESGNKGVNNSYALCKVTFNTEDSNLYVDCINYAESNYDFGLLSNLNTTLSLSSSEDTTGVFKNFKGASSASVQTVDYGVISAGENFIYIKFRKDGSSYTGNDSLQFKIRFE